MYRINNWNNEGSGWVIESIDAEYANMFILIPLSGSTYIELSHRLRNSMEGLINVKTNDNKFFLWRHIKFLNPLNRHPEKITKAVKNIGNDLHYENSKFPVSKKRF